MTAAPQRGPSAPVVALLLAGLLVVGAVGIVLFVRNDLPNRQSYPGPAAAEEFTVAYIDALNANDAATLGDLLGEPLDSQVLETQLSRYGGRGLTDVQTTADAEFPGVYRVEVSATDHQGAQVTFHLILVWEGDAWSVASSS